MLGVSTDTIGAHLDACEAGYILLQCPCFTYSEKQRAARHRKDYPIDLGWRDAVIAKGGADRGEIAPYQVSWEGIKDRHRKALEEFYQQYPRARPAVFISRENVEAFLSTGDAVSGRRLRIRRRQRPAAGQIGNPAAGAGSSS